MDANQVDDLTDAIYQKLVANGVYINSYNLERINLVITEWLVSHNLFEDESEDE